jgi:ribosome-binding protein aMBF1 (putative translation factor)
MVPIDSWRQIRIKQHHHLGFRERQATAFRFERLYYPKDFRNRGRGVCRRSRGEDEGETLSQRALSAITGAQAKAARELLGWTQAYLSIEARVSPATVSQFEAEDRIVTAPTVSKMQGALEAAGVAFDEDGGVRIVKPGDCNHTR